MSNSLACPEIGSWSELLGDTVPRELRERYERHLESCRACQQLLDDSEEKADGLVQLARQIGDPTTIPADPTLVEVLERMRDVNGSQASAKQELYFLGPSERSDILGILGNYEVHDVLGQGGMGLVLKAFDPLLQRLVAIKVVAAAAAGSATARRRFIREAKAAAAVVHDHIVAVHGVHEANGLPYLVMQFVEGESLQSRLDRVGPLDLMEIVLIGQQTASGLAAAHAQGLIHRDIKPANLMLEGDVAGVKIADFGLAKMIDDEQMTQSGVVAGTPDYMAPEQARGETVDHRADLFSLGSVLYAMCTGVPPFKASTAMAILRQVSDREPTPVRELNPAILAWLAALIARLMAKAPGDRIQSAAEVADLLATYVAHLRQPATVPAPEFLLPPNGFLSTKPLASARSKVGPWMLVAIAAASLLALGTMVGGGWLRWTGITAMATNGTEARPANEPKIIEPRNGLVCLLVNKNSGRCLSIKDKSSEPGAKLVQGPKPEEAERTEQWVLLETENVYRLRNASTGLVVEIGNANPNQGVQAIQWHQQPAAKHQQWVFEPVGGGFLLRAQHNQLVLSIGQGSQDDGGRAVQWDYHGDIPEEIWELRPLPGQEERGHVAYDFRAPLSKYPELSLHGPDVETLAKTDEAGLRFNIPAGQRDTRPRSMEIPHRLQGDFDIVLGYEFLAVGEPLPQYGAGLALRVWFDDPSKTCAIVSRAKKPYGGTFGGHKVIQGPDGKDQYLKNVDKPATKTKGKLRLQRTGATLDYLVAEDDQEFRTIQTVEIGIADVQTMRVDIFTMYKPIALDVRLTELVIDADKGVAARPAVAAPVPVAAERDRKALWVVVVLGGLSVLCFVGGGVWFYVRQRRNSQGKAPTPLSRHESPPADASPKSVSVRCSGCERVLKIKADLAGKKVKCPKCGTSAIVPSSCG